MYVYCIMALCVHLCHFTDLSTNISQVGSQHVVSCWSQPHYNNGPACLSDIGMFGSFYATSSSAVESLCNGCLVTEYLRGPKWIVGYPVLLLGESPGHGWLAGHVEYLCRQAGSQAGTAFKF